MGMMSKRKCSAVTGRAIEKSINRFTDSRDDYTKWDFYELMYLLFESGRVTIREMSDITGIERGVIMDRLHYLRVLSGSRMKRPLTGNDRKRLNDLMRGE